MLKEWMSVRLNFDKLIFISRFFFLLFLTSGERMNVSLPLVWQVNFHIHFYLFIYFCLFTFFVCLFVLEPNPPEYNCVLFQALRRNSKLCLLDLFVLAFVFCPWALSSAYRRNKANNSCATLNGRHLYRHATLGRHTCSSLSRTRLSLILARPHACRSAQPLVVVPRRLLMDREDND